MRRPIKYSLSLQKKGNCSKNKEHCKNISKMETTNIIHVMHHSTQAKSSAHLAHPLHNHGSCSWTLLQYRSMDKHVIPLHSKLIIPKEIPHHLRCGILKYGSATVLGRSSLRRHQNKAQSS